MSNKSECSAAFLAAFRTGTWTPETSCCCGRTFFFDGSPDIEPARLDKLRERVAAGDAVVALPHEAETVEFLGVIAVNGCPCEAAPRYEQRVRAAASQFCKFLVAVKDERLRAADGIQL